MPKKASKPKKPNHKQQQHRQPVLVARRAPQGAIRPRAPPISAAAAQYALARLNPRLGIGAKIPDKHSGITAAIQSYTSFSLPFTTTECAIVVQPQNPNKLFSVAFNGVLAAPNTAASDYATWSPLVTSTRLVSCSVEIVQNFAANERPGIAACGQLEAKEALPNPAAWKGATYTHLENLTHGCFQIFNQGNASIDYSVFQAVGSTVTDYARVFIYLDGLTVGCNYTLQIVCNYEVTPVILAQSTLSAAKSPSIPGLVDRLDTLCNKLPSNASRDFVQEHRGTSKQASLIVSALTGLANAASNIPGIVGSVASGASSLLKRLFG